MIYLSGKSRKKRQYISYAVYATLFIVVVLFWSFFKKNIYHILEPSVGGYSQVKDSFSIFPEFVSTYTTSHKTFSERQKTLELEIERLENKLAEKEGTIRELSLITLAVNQEQSTQAPPLVLYPLIKDSLGIYSTVLLSKGFKDGIEVNDIVFVRGRQAVCTIKEVYNSSSLCLLLTGDGVTTEGVTASSSIGLSLTGRGGYFLGNIVRDTPIAIGEKIYLRNDPAMLLGEVVDVSNNNQDTSWHIFVRGAYNPVTSSVFYVQK